MQPQPFYQVVADDFAAVDGIIRKQLTSRVPLVEKIGDYITSAGGKRLRPLLVLLSGSALGHQGEQLRLLAAIIEFLHTSTLLRDDVVDMSGMRRGRSTANALWGNAPSVLVGDFLYARSFEMMVELDSMPVMRIISRDPGHRRRRSAAVVEGSRRQHHRRDLHGSHPWQDRDALRGLDAQCRHLAGASEQQREALRTFGDHLGIAFQLVDDLLDYRAMPKPSARTLAMTSPKANPRYR